MPALYLFGGVELAEALRATGDARGSASVLATTRDVGARDAARRRRSRVEQAVRQSQHPTPPV
jgi:hypothetical protein